MGGFVRWLMPVMCAGLAAGCLSDETGKRHDPNTRQICDREGVVSCERGGPCPAEIGAAGNGTRRDSPTIGP